MFAHCILGNALSALQSSLFQKLYLGPLRKWVGGATTKWYQNRRHQNPVAADVKCTILILLAATRMGPRKRICFRCKRWYARPYVPIGYKKECGRESGHVQPDLRPNVEL